jgi:hypothetical protein
MLALIERSPDIYIDEIQDQLYEQHDLDISLSTVGETLKRLLLLLAATSLLFSWQQQQNSYAPPSPSLSPILHPKHHPAPYPRMVPLLMWEG